MRKTYAGGILSWILIVGCGQAQPTAAVVGQIDGLTLGWVTRVQAVRSGLTQGSPLDAQRSFRLELLEPGAWKLRLTDDAASRAVFVVFADGSDVLLVAGDSPPIDLGAIKAAGENARAEDPLSSDEPDSSTTSTDDPADAGFDSGTCGSVTDCRFEVYNLNVQVGDRFVLTSFLERCDGQVGRDFVFRYAGGETWHLDDFNNNEVVEIVTGDLSGGNHGDGEYRLFLFSTAGEELDHMTVRVGHGSESDVHAADAIPPASGPASCEGAGGTSSGSPEPGTTPPPDASTNPPPSGTPEPASCQETSDCGPSMVCLAGMCVSAI